MAEALGAAGSIAGIVSFGLQLATTLQTYIETMLEAENRLRDITFDINSTASALRQLQDIIDDDKTGTGVDKLTSKVFKDEGRREIEAIAQKCGKVYRTIVLLVNKAGSLDPKNAVSTASSDVVPLKISSLTRMMKWPWVEPHIKRCQEQLRWLKMSLLFNLQLASLARLQLGTQDKTTGEDEIVIRKMVVFLRRNEINAARALTRKPENRRAVASPSSSSSTSSASAHVFSRALVSQSPPEEIKPTEKPMSNLSIRARSFGPGAEELSDMGAMSEKENNPINTDNIFQLNMIQQNAPLYTPGNVPTINGFHQLEKNTRNLRRITTRISEEPGEPSKGNRSITNEIPSEPREEPRQGPQVFRDVVDKITDGSKNASKHSINQQDISPRVTGEGSSIREKGLALATSIQQSRSTVSGMSRIKRLPSWLKEIFSPHGDSFDWESETLEAFVILDDSSDIIRVPFGDRGLRRLKKKLDVSWDKYASLESDQHQLVDKAILEAKLMDPRERICLGVGLYPRAEDHAIFVFFSLGDHVEPIYFTDFLGREFKFPFQVFRLWDKSNPWFIQLFQHMNEVGWYVSDGCYDILDDKGNILMPHTIKSSIEPGSRLGMRMWAKPEIDHGLLIAEKEAIQKSKAIAGYLAIGEEETEGKTPVIKLEDALGRMYAFPFHISKTWDEISALITQAFSNIEFYAPHVARGHYDLLGPDNCRILPQLWEVTVQPGWLIIMCLWPQPEYPSDLLVPWHIIPTPRRNLSSAPPPFDRRPPVPLSPILRNSGANIANFYNPNNDFRSEDYHTNIVPDSNQESSRARPQRSSSQTSGTPSRLGRDYDADQSMPPTPLPILRRPVTDHPSEYPSQDPYRSERGEGRALIREPSRRRRTKLGRRVPTRSSGYEDKMREAAGYQDDVGRPRMPPSIPLNAEVLKRERRRQAGSETENYSMLERPPGSSGNRQRHREDHSPLPPTRQRRTERIVIVDAPPTTRTPSQVYKQQFTAPSSPILSPGHNSSPETKDERVISFGGRENTQSSDSFLNDSNAQGAGVSFEVAAIAASRQSKTDGHSGEIHFRPSIDPQYGDLLPLPPSEPGTSTDEYFGEFPSLPESLPHTPEDISPQSSSTEKYLQGAPLKSPSRVAVPISFKWGHGNTSWDSMEEYRPLYLLERSEPESRGGEGDKRPLPELPVSSPIAAGHSQSAGIPQSATSQQQSARILTHAKALGQISRSYSNGHAAQSTTPGEKEREKVPIRPSTVQLIEVFDESMPPPRMPPQFSADSWKLDSISGESEESNIGNGAINSVPTSSPLSDEDIDLSLDIDVETEYLSIGELLERYTNATDTAIGVNEDHKIESSGEVFSRGR